MFFLNHAAQLCHALLHCNFLAIKKIVKPPWQRNFVFWQKFINTIRFNTLQNRFQMI